ncbi:unnamed protein product [Ixodes hexagonus]
MDKRAVCGVGSSSGIPKIMVFRPSLDEMKDFSQYLEYMESQGAHKAGLAKIIPPREWIPRKSGYEDIQMTIPSPISQVVTGGQGLYQQYNIQKKAMTVKDFKRLAESDRYRTPVHFDYEDLERKYWKNVAYNPPIYGADVSGSLYDPGVKEFNINHLNTILDLVGQDYGIKIEGVNTAYLYFGMWKTTFAWHTEDMDLYSINYLHFGAPKSWYCIPPEHGRRLERLAAGFFHGTSQECSAFLRHKMTVISPQILRQYSIPFNKITQEPGEFMVTFPYGYHAGFNHGFNCAESTNFALPRWVEYGKRASQCVCRLDCVKISMDVFVKKLQPEKYELWLAGKDVGSHPEDPTRVSAAPPPTYVEMAMLARIPCLVRVCRVKPKSKRHPVAPAGECPAEEDGGGDTDGTEIYDPEESGRQEDQTPKRKRQAKVPAQPKRPRAGAGATKAPNGATPKRPRKPRSQVKAKGMCKKNIDCNSGRMEVEAALIMFRRSFEKHGLRYTTVLSDGDSRTYHALTEDAVYGFVEIEKKDCLNHVHKRMGSALRTLVDKKKAQGKALGGKGRLTQDKIKRITNYYGYALRSHSHDVPAMQRAVQATLRHMSSTDESPDHSFCPEGANSWCSYNRALANSEQPRGHKNALPDFVREALEPVFARLGDKDLLERCSDGKTQNPSESLHAVIWAQTSKNTHASLFSVQRAVAEAVSVFNQGQKKTNESVVASLGYTAGSALIRRSIEKDDRRLHKANKDQPASPEPAFLTPPPKKALLRAKNPLLIGLLLGHVSPPLSTVQTRQILANQLAIALGLILLSRAFLVVGQALLSAMNSMNASRGRIKLKRLSADAPRLRSEPGVATWAAPYMDLWSFRPASLYAERQFNRYCSTLEPHCALCVLFRPLRYSLERAPREPAQVPESSAVWMPSLCFVNGALDSSSGTPQALPEMSEVASSPLLVCSECSVCVHAHCYGIPWPLSSSEPWKCERCAQQAVSVDCCLCTLRGGALKRTADGRWAHLACALLVPEVHVDEGPTRSPVDVRRITPQRARLRCWYCHKLRDRLGRPSETGACIQCTFGRCVTAFHVTCAHAAGVSFETYDWPLPIFVTCTKHANSPERKASPRSCSAVPPVINQINKHVKSDQYKAEVAWEFNIDITKVESGQYKAECARKCDISAEIVFSDCLIIRTIWESLVCDIGALTTLVSGVTCPACHEGKLSVRESAGKRKGLASFLELHCENSECPESVLSSTPRQPKDSTRTCSKSCRWKVVANVSAPLATTPTTSCSCDATTASRAEGVGLSADMPPRCPPLYLRREDCTTLR